MPTPLIETIERGGELTPALIAPEAVLAAQNAVREQTLTRLQSLSKTIQDRLKTLEADRVSIAASTNPDIVATREARLSAINASVTALSNLNDVINTRITNLLPPVRSPGAVVLDAITGLPETVRNAPQNLTDRMMGNPLLQWGVLGAVAYTGYRALSWPFRRFIGESSAAAESTGKTAAATTSTNRQSTAGMSLWKKGLIAAGVLLVGSAAVGTLTSPGQRS